MQPQPFTTYVGTSRSYDTLSATRHREGLRFSSYLGGAPANGGRTNLSVPVSLEHEAVHHGGPHMMEIAVERVRHPRLVSEDSRRARRHRRANANLAEARALRQRGAFRRRRNGKDDMLPVRVWARYPSRRMWARCDKGARFGMRSVLSAPGQLLHRDRPSTVWPAHRRLSEAHRQQLVPPPIGTRPIAGP